MDKWKGNLKRKMVSLLRAAQNKEIKNYVKYTHGYEKESQ